MRDAKKEIVTALITSISAKLPTRDIFTIVPKPINDSGAAAPLNYILISDIYQQDESPKNSLIYSYDVLVQVVYNNVTSKITFWSDISSVVSIISSRRDLVLTNDFQCQEIGLLSNSEEEIWTDTGRKNIGVVRFKVDVKDHG